MDFKEFPIRQQMNRHDCSVCVIWCILRYAGIDITYRDLYRFIHPPIGPNDGVSGEQVMKILRSFGINVVSETSNISKLRIDTNNWPVIVSIQHKKKRNVDWKNIIEFGHYVIVLKVDDKKVKFMDPNYGKIRSLNIKDFKDRWHDGDENELCKYPAIICMVNESKSIL